MATIGNAGLVILPFEEATANDVPAAAILRMWGSLAGISGRKVFGGGLLSLK